MTDDIVSRLQTYTGFDAYGVSRPHNRDGHEAADLISTLRAENAKLREVLEAIDELLSDELKTRYGTSSHLDQSEVAGKAKLYSLLIVPRNIARTALQSPAAQHRSGEPDALLNAPLQSDALGRGEGGE